MEWNQRRRIRAVLSRPPKELSEFKPGPLFLMRAGKVSFLRDHIDGDPSGPLVVTGPAGAGKTMLLRRALADRPHSVYLSLRASPCSSGEALSLALVQSAGYLMPPTELLSRAIFNRDLATGATAIELERALRLITDVLVAEKARGWVVKGAGKRGGEGLPLVLPPVICIDELNSGEISNGLLDDSQFWKIVDWAMHLGDNRLAHVVFACGLEVADLLDAFGGFRMRRSRIHFDFPRVGTVHDYFSKVLNPFMGEVLGAGQRPALTRPAGATAAAAAAGAGQPSPRQLTGEAAAAAAAPGVVADASSNGLQPFSDEEQANQPDTSAHRAVEASGPVPVRERLLLQPGQQSDAASSAAATRLPSAALPSAEQRLSTLPIPPPPASDTSRDATRVVSLPPHTAEEEEAARLTSTSSSSPSAPLSPSLTPPEPATTWAGAAAGKDDRAAAAASAGGKKGGKLKLFKHKGESRADGAAAAAREGAEEAMAASSESTAAAGGEVPPAALASAGGEKVLATAWFASPPAAPASASASASPPLYLLEPWEIGRIVDVIGGHLKDIDSVVSAIVRGRHWSQALERLVSDSCDLVERTLDDLLAAVNDGPGSGGTAGGRGLSGSAASIGKGGGGRTGSGGRSSVLRSSLGGSGLANKNEMVPPPPHDFSLEPSPQRLAAYCRYLRVMALIRECADRKYTPRRDLLNRVFPESPQELDHAIDLGLVMSVNLRNTMRAGAGGPAGSQLASSPEEAGGGGGAAAGPSLTLPGTYVSASSPRMRVAFRVLAADPKLQAQTARVAAAVALVRLRREEALLQGRISEVTGERSVLSSQLSMLLSRETSLRTSIIKDVMSWGSPVVGALLTGVAPPAAPPQQKPAAKAADGAAGAGGDKVASDDEEAGKVPATVTPEPPQTATAAVIALLQNGAVASAAAAPSSSAAAPLPPAASSMDALAASALLGAPHFAASLARTERSLGRTDALLESLQRRLEQVRYSAMLAQQRSEVPLPDTEAWYRLVRAAHVTRVVYAGIRPVPGEGGGAGGAGGGSEGSTAAARPGGGGEEGGRSGSDGSVAVSAERNRDPESGSPAHGSAASALECGRIAAQDASSDPLRTSDPGVQSAKGVSEAVVQQRAQSDGGRVGLATGSARQSWPSLRVFRGNTYTVASGGDANPADRAVPAAGLGAQGRGRGRPSGAASSSSPRQRRAAAAAYAASRLASRYGDSDDSEGDDGDGFSFEALPPPGASSAAGGGGSPLPRMRHRLQEEHQAVDDAWFRSVHDSGGSGGASGGWWGSGAEQGTAGEGGADSDGGAVDVLYQGAGRQARGRVQSEQQSAGESGYGSGSEPEVGDDVADARDESGRYDRQRLAPPSSSSQDGRAGSDSRGSAVGLYGGDLTPPPSAAGDAEGVYTRFGSYASDGGNRQAGSTEAPSSTGSAGVTTSSRRGPRVGRGAGTVGGSGSAALAGSAAAASLAAQHAQQAGGAVAHWPPLDGSHPSGGAPTAPRPSSRVGPGHYGGYRWWL
jgi:hypothetical protein